MTKKWIPLICCICLLAACTGNNKEVDQDAGVTMAVTPQLSYTLVSIYPHDTSAYTEGLLINEGKLYESTGYTDELPQTRSLFGVVNLKTGRIEPKVQLDTSKYFGEGIVFLHDQWYQLTYRTKIGFVYAANTFKQVKTFVLPVKEGWGMTTDSTLLIMSEGTNIITYVDPFKLTVVRKISVEDETGPVLNINELEYIRGFIYANIYGTSFIIKINPANGKVMGKTDFTLLKSQQRNAFAGAKEMNGIAYNPLTGKIFVTGKMWPNLFEIELNQ
ncbi:glutaminyl-peptide cyclotransferase [Ferruginibacter paludis]|uniref:glutaminyl-peptide cyclotransferase n=1 Tax=Ferruginibacter paludis TaxID=1310417 RepID=UPI0025B4ADF9|nr:glutaminyl-peptide cyclotransferase [Ferruginibacter paludis]MDN3657003.1 glutaminyl-peptide cyclotransferase [Ferruginibacter paludis]